MRTLFSTCQTRRAVFVRHEAQTAAPVCGSRRVYCSASNGQFPGMSNPTASQGLDELRSGLSALSEKNVQHCSVIEADGMPAAALASALEDSSLEQPVAAARHVQSEVYAALRPMLPGVRYHAGAGMLLYRDPTGSVAEVQKLPGNVVIVCGSGVDIQMAYEAKVALELMGAYSTMMRGVTPTKLASLLQHAEQLSAADAVIVCCSEQPALAGLVLSLVSVPVIAIPGVSRPDPNQAIAISGACAVAPGDGVSAASVAVRTLRVARQYIQHRKDMLQVLAADQEPLNPEDKHLDRQPVDYEEVVVPRSNGAMYNGSAVHANGSRQ